MASTTSTTSTTKGPGLSCDNCRLRKVRCSRATPCSQCSHLDLPCLYSQVPRKRANPVRGRLIAQARDHSASLSSGLGHHGSGGPGPVSHRSPASSHHQYAGGGGVDDEAHWSPRTNHSGTHEFAPEFFLNLLDDFEQVVFPFSPIITAAELTDIIRNHTNNDNNSTLEDEALIYAFAAVTTYLRNTDAVSQHSHEKDHLNTLLQLGLRAYRQIDLGDPRPPKDIMYLPLPGGGGGHDNSPLSSTLKRIITSIFIEISMMAFKSYDRSFALLREQVCMIQMIETNRRLQPRGVFPAAVYSSPRYMRIYWEVFIHERFLSINVGYPSILPPLAIGVPVLDPGIPLYIDVGFRRLIHLFMILDEAFLAHWHGMQQQQNGALDGAAQTLTPTLTLHWIETKQLQLDEDEQQATQAEEEVSMHLASTPSDSRTTTTTTSSPVHNRDSPRNVMATTSTTPSSSSSPFAPRDDSIRALQHIDQYVTRLWLRTLLWQLALSRGLLSSEPSPHSHEGLSLHFPAQWLSSQLRSLVDRLDSFAAINTQGTGVLQKLFEITSTIADVMALPLPSHGNNSNAPPPAAAASASTSSSSSSSVVRTPGSLNGLAGSPGSVGVGTDGGGRGPHSHAAAEDEAASRATRMRDFATLVGFLLRFDRVRSEQREYLEEKLRSLGGLYDGGGGGGGGGQEQQRQQQQSSPYYLAY